MGVLDLFPEANARMEDYLSDNLAEFPVREFGESWSATWDDVWQRKLSISEDQGMYDVLSERLNEIERLTGERLPGPKAQIGRRQHSIFDTFETQKAELQQRHPDAQLPDLTRDSVYYEWLNRGRKSASEMGKYAASPRQSDILGLSAFTVGSLAGEASGFAVDPTNIMLAPFGLGGGLARAVVTESLLALASGAMIEAETYETQRLTDPEYDINDALANIGMNAAFGAATPVVLRGAMLTAKGVGRGTAAASRAVFPGTYQGARALANQWNNWRAPAPGGAQPAPAPAPTGQQAAPAPATGAQPPPTAPAPTPAAPPPAPSPAQALAAGPGATPEPEVPDAAAIAKKQEFVARMKAAREAKRAARAPVDQGEQDAANVVEHEAVGQPPVSDPDAAVAANQGVASIEAAVETNTPPPPSLPPVVEPPRTRAFDPDGREVGLHYKVVELDELVSSNNDDFSINRAYPADLQPRDRKAAGLQAQVINISSKLNPELLGPSPHTGEGAPIVAPDMVVESGNGRTMALRRIYNGQDGAFSAQAAAYRAFLERSGYNIAGMKRPVLVGVRQNEMTTADRIAYTTASNRSTVASLSPSEQAAADARLLDSGTLSKLQPTGVGSAGNREFATSVAAKLSAEDSRDMFRDDGELSIEGIRRLDAAVMARAYGKQSLLKKIFEDPDNNIKAIGGALRDAANDWVRLVDDIANGRVPQNMDITDDLMDAIDQVILARDGGDKVKDRLDNVDFFGGPSATARSLVGKFFKDDAMTRPASRESIAKLLREYARLARKEAEERVIGEAMTVDDILRRFGLEPDAEEVVDLFGPSSKIVEREGLPPQQPTEAELFVPTPDPAPKIVARDHDAARKELLALIDSGASKEELKANPYVIEVNAEVRQLAKNPTIELADPDGKPLPIDHPKAYMNPERRRERIFVFGKKMGPDGTPIDDEVKGYGAALARLIKGAKAFSTNGPVKREKRAIIILGPPASGKSTLAEEIARNRHFAIVDPDEAKKVMPEFAGGLGSTRVHEESSGMSADMISSMSEAGWNIILPKVDGTPEKLMPPVNQLRRMGYTVELVNLYVHPDNAFIRMMRRFGKTGRLIDPDYFDSIGFKPRELFHKVKEQFNGHLEVDGNGPPGTLDVTDGDINILGRPTAIGEGPGQPDVGDIRQRDGTPLATEAGPPPVGRGGVPAGEGGFSAEGTDFNARLLNALPKARKEGGDRMAHHNAIRKAMKLSKEEYERLLLAWIDDLRFRTEMKVPGYDVMLGTATMAREKGWIESKIAIPKTDDVPTSMTTGIILRPSKGKPAPGVGAKRTAAQLDEWVSAGNDNLPEVARVTMEERVKVEKVLGLLAKIRDGKPISSAMVEAPFRNKAAAKRIFEGNAATRSQGLRDLFGHENPDLLAKEEAARVSAADFERGEWTNPEDTIRESLEASGGELGLTPAQIAKEVKYQIDNWRKRTPNWREIVAKAKGETKVTFKPVTIKGDDLAVTVAQNDNGQFAVVAKDIESGEQLPTVSIFKDKDKAIAHAEKLSGKGATKPPKKGRTKGPKKKTPEEQIAKQLAEEHRPSPAENPAAARTLGETPQEVAETVNGALEDPGIAAGAIADMQRLEQQLAEAGGYPLDIPELQPDGSVKMRTVSDIMAEIDEEEAAARSLTSCAAPEEGLTA